MPFAHLNTIQRHSASASTNNAEKVHVYVIRLLQLPVLIQVGEHLCEYCLWELSHRISMFSILYTNLKLKLSVYELIYENIAHQFERHIHRWGYDWRVVPRVVHKYPEGTASLRSRWRQSRHPATTGTSYWEKRCLGQKLCCSHLGKGWCCSTTIIVKINY
jgi:hypothetical protein